jgi:hypothetical protein
MKVIKNYGIILLFWKKEKNMYISRVIIKNYRSIKDLIREKML